MENIDKPQHCVDSSNTRPSLKEKTLDQSIERSRNFLLSIQNEDGYWVDELESNVTISAEFIFFMHFTGRLDSLKQEKIVKYLLRQQRDDGSWSLFYGGLCDINSTVESYMALKMAGLPADQEEMVQARQAIFSNGGIKNTRVPVFLLPTELSVLSSVVRSPFSNR